MKKNKMMRLASGLLVAVLITTSTISGTFAKYVTEDMAQDDARVAKFGVVVTADGYLFDDTYKKATANIPGDDGDDAAALSVVSNTTILDPSYTKGANVVAPGTKNEDGIKFAIKGKPEVDVEVDIAASGLDIYLKKGTYPDMTTGDLASFTNDIDPYYYPVVFTLTQTKYDVNGVPLPATTTTGTLADIATALDQTVNYDANTDLATIYGDYELTWEWAFEDPSNLVEVDQNDTLLGGLAADKLDGTTIVAKKATDLGIAALVENTHYCLDTDFLINIQVTQIN